MNVIFASSKDRLVVPYSTMLILRDNVLHHLQAGRVAPGYPLLHSLADPRALGHHPLPAAALWEEMSLALAGLHQRNVVDLAVSVQTRALLTGVRDAPAPQATVLARLTGWEMPFQLCSGSTLALDSLFGELRSGLERLTWSGKFRGAIHVFASNIFDELWNEAPARRLH